MLGLTEQADVALRVVGALEAMGQARPCSFVAIVGELYAEWQADQRRPLPPTRDELYDALKGLEATGDVAYVPHEGWRLATR